MNIINTNYLKARLGDHEHSRDYLESLTNSLPPEIKHLAIDANVSPNPRNVLPEGSSQSLVNTFYCWQLARIGCADWVLKEIELVNRLKDEIGAERFDSGVDLCDDLRGLLQRDVAAQVGMTIKEWPLNAINWAKMENDVIKNSIYKTVNYGGTRYYKS